MLDIFTALWLARLLLHCRQLQYCIAQPTQQHFRLRKSDYIDASRPTSSLAEQIDRQLHSELGKVEATIGHEQETHLKWLQNIIISIYIYFATITGICS